MTRLFGLLLALFTVGLVADVNAQGSENPVHSHTLYTYDGSVLKGEIVQWTTDTVTLRLFSGVEMKVGALQIRRITSRSSRSAAGMLVRAEKAYGFKESGIYNVSTLGISTGPFLGANASHATGYRFAHWFGLGGGIGIASYDLGSGNQMLPVFVETRGFMLKKNFSPYYAIRVGHGFALTSDQSDISEAKGGSLFHAELGYRFGGSRAVNFLAGLGMHWQKAQYRQEWPWESVFLDRVTYRRTELRLGVIF